jgi:hypothetical protein
LRELELDMSSKAGISGVDPVDVPPRLDRQLHTDPGRVDTSYIDQQLGLNWMGLGDRRQRRNLQNQSQPPESSRAHAKRKRLAVREIPGRIPLTAL